MPTEVTNRQLFFILFVILTAGSLVPAAKIMAVSAGHGAWIPVMLAALLVAIMAAIIVHLNKMFAGDTLFEYSGKIFGRFVAYVLAVLYILFFSVLSSYYCFTFFALVKANFLLKTPEWALLLFTMPFLGLIAYRGMRNIGRLAVVVGVLFLCTSCIFYVTMFFEGQLDYIRPLLIKSELGQDLRAVKDSFIQYTGISIITLIPMTQKNKKPSKSVFFAILSIGLFYLISIYGCYAMIGMEEIKYHRYPLIDAIRLIRYMKIEFLQRVDILYMTMGFMRVFVAQSLIYLAAVEYLCKIFAKAKRAVIVLSTGIILYFVEMLLIKSSDIGDQYPNLIDILAIFFSYAIPLLLVIAAKVKKHG